MGNDNDQEKSKKENETDKGNEENTNKNEFDLTPDQVKDMVIEKRNLQALVDNLTLQNNTLQCQLAMYQQNANYIQGNFQNLKNTANFTMGQAAQQILFLQNQNQNLNKQIYQMKQNENALNFKINQLQFYCNKIQLMLLNKMQEISMKDNINSMQKMNMSTNNQIKNNNNNNNMNNFNYQRTENSINIIFNVNNKMKCPIAVFPNHKLGNVFSLALYQNGYTNFINIKNFTFHFNTQNISNCFYDNKEVSSINFGSLTFPCIEVSGNFN